MRDQWQGREARTDHDMREDLLAVNGGRPIRKRHWPKWPRANAQTQRNLLDVLHSTKWTLSGQSEKSYSYEKQFSEAFAQYCNVPYSVACSSGSSALAMALQVLNIGPGDEVIVPGLTWVACASSICHVGAIPVLVDVSPKTLCLSLTSIEQHITANTKAIVAVHLYSSLAPMVDLCAIGKRFNIPVIEDASQAHGALLNGKRAGTWGNIGVFSMQQSKLLSCGEGGACITSDYDLFLKLQQLRADGRIYRTGEMSEVEAEENITTFNEIIPCGQVLGRNACLSEFHAAILCDRLGLLDIENEHRHKNFLKLKEKFKSLPYIQLVVGEPSELPTHYRICLRLQGNPSKGWQINEIAKAVSAELGLPCEPIDKPLHVNPLYCPEKSLIYKYFADAECVSSLMPYAIEAMHTHLTLPHWCLLGDESDLDDIVRAFKKVFEIGGFQ